MSTPFNTRRHRVENAAIAAGAALVCVSLGIIAVLPLVLLQFVGSGVLSTATLRWARTKTPAAVAAVLVGISSIWMSILLSAWAFAAAWEAESSVAPVLLTVAVLPAIGIYGLVTGARSRRRAGTTPQPSE
jgi:hypothetical protein